jgi:hypothetical protein
MAQNRSCRLEKKPSIKLSLEPCLGDLEAALGLGASHAFVCLNMRATVMVMEDQTVTLPLQR